MPGLLQRYKFDRWNAKKLRKLDRADVVLLRYPKSGVTWLRVMITHIYRSRMGLPPSHLIGSQEFETIAPEAPRLFVAMDNIGIARDALRARLAARKTVLLLRDPRDVAVSLYFHFAKRSTALERMAFGIPADVERHGIFAFVTNAQYGLPRIVDFMSYWATALDGHANAVTLRYEDLKAAPDQGLGRVMAVLDATTTADEIGAAVDFAAFEKMKSMEATGNFGLDILKPGDSADTDSFKVRRGKVGGYVDYFSVAERAAIDALMRQSSAGRPDYG